VTQLVTGDAVLLDLRPARVPSRLLATGIDLVIMFGASYLYGYIVNQVGGSEARVQAVIIAGVLLINFGYLIAMETLTRGRTVGAFALGLRVVRDDGGAIRFRQALTRGLAFWAVDFAPWTGFCGGLICAAVNQQSKRLGDLMAGTIVIRTRPPRPPVPIPPVRADLAPWAAQLELSRLPDDLVTASRHLVQRSDGLSRYPRDQLARDLARQVAADTAPSPPSALPPLEFLAGVVAERRQRERTKLTPQQWVPAAEDLPAGWR
jgi:uncharacterized RDD family membrane protein YckC